MKLSVNSPCPCHSDKKYKQCCQPYHKGILPSNALRLMRSRYSAYALKLGDYIISTTHKNNPDFTDNLIAWREGIDAFCENTLFERLEILQFTDGEEVAFVTFRATLNGQIFQEQSRFVNEDGKWFYESGTFE